MDNNLLVAVVTSVTTAASTAGVAITALVLNNKRFDLIERRLDKIESKLEGVESKLGELSVDVALLKAGIKP